MSKQLPNAAARWVGFGLAIVATIAIAIMTNRGGFKRPELRQVEGYKAWDPEVVEIAKRIPVQDGGRVKPFETRAGFLMLRLHGKRSMTIRDDRGDKIKIGPTEWLLDSLFRPDLAMELPTFRVEDSDLLEEVGVEVKKRRDRYSYADLEPGLQKLGQLAGGMQEEIQQAMKEDPDFTLSADRKKRDPRELASKIFAYQGMLGALDFARRGVTLEESALGEVENREEMGKVSFWLKMLPTLGALLRQQGTDPSEQLPPHVESLLSEVNFLMARASRGIEWLPPYEAQVPLPAGGSVQVYSGTTPKTYRIKCEEGALKVFEGKALLAELQAGEVEEFPGADLKVVSGDASSKVLIRGKEWMSFGARSSAVAEGPDVNHWTLLAEDAARMEKLVAAYEQGTSAFTEQLEEWRGEITDRALEQGEGESLESEITYFDRHYFIRSLVFFLLAFVVTAVSWLSPSSLWGRVTTIGSWSFGVLALGFLVAGIIHRSVLMDRPPVGNLYDSIPFIAAGGVLVLFLLEAKTRRRIALGVAIAVGVLGMFLTPMFESVDAKDHMDPLRAVLRSNFWLATHVVIITLGYSGGLIAAAMSHIYLYARAFGLDRSDPTLRRFLNRSVYGLICFTLLFSLVGTVLGGIWANDSWGRFWGWDPKENGALMIVLWCLIILHARLGGYLKEWGLHIMSVLGAVVVAFSWWGVNLLETGLHSYGFTQGLGKTVAMFYVFEFLVAGGGLFLAILDKTGHLGSARSGDDGSPSLTEGASAR